MNGYNTKSIYGDDEKTLIGEFVDVLNSANKKGMYLSGYMINKFDNPYILHKITSYGFDLPNILDNYDKKPWEVKIFDIADKWKSTMMFYASLDEVCYELDIDSPKDDIDGSQVHYTYWEENGLERIKTYCEKDVLSTMMVGKKMLELIK